MQIINIRSNGSSKACMGENAVLRTSFIRKLDQISRILTWLFLHVDY